MHSRTDRITEPGPFNITPGTTIVVFLNPLGVRHREPPLVFGRTPTLPPGRRNRKKLDQEPLSRCGVAPPALCVKVACGIKTKRQRLQFSSACYEHPSEMSTLAHALHPYVVSFFPEGLKPRNYRLTYRADVCQRNVRFLNTADLMINGQSAETATSQLTDQGHVQIRKQSRLRRFFRSSLLRITSDLRKCKTV